VRPSARALAVVPRSADSRALSGRRSDTVQRAHPVAIFLVTAGIFMPPTMVIFLGGLKLLPGRIAIIILFLPALCILFKRLRRVLASDLFVFATAAWILIASLTVEGLNSITSASIEALELFGAYVIARAYVFGRPALETFIQIFKVITIALIMLALLDTLTGRLLTIEITAQLFGTTKYGSPSRSLFGIDVIRATAIFEHTILYGTFCALAAALFLYSERTARRIVYFGLCSFGCLLAVSSAPLMSLAIVAAIYNYDRVLKRFSWRWKVFWLAIAALLAAVFMVSNHPVASIIARLTFDPTSGYYRIMIWELAMPQIAISPLTGFGFESFNDPVLDSSVDSVWLVLALRFGIPTIAFLLLANLASFLRSGQATGGRLADPYMDSMRTGFTLVLAMFLFTGLTVHYWNGSWMFWGLCLGIRASLNEYCNAIRLQAPAFVTRRRMRSGALSSTKGKKSPMATMPRATF
jgi:O-antigen ligase